MCGEFSEWCGKLIIPFSFVRERPGMTENDHETFSFFFSILIEFSLINNIDLYFNINIL